MRVDIKAGQLGIFDPVIYTIIVLRKFVIKQMYYLVR